ncbi:PhzF family phenazine biosynthesis protein [Candidatus Izimaplasma bacterium]|nr:PhzF family phenazine biosynthesis protein [Candidatus Izimaplasma bacterium]
MYELYRLSAFPKTRDGGNKAGVVLNGDYLSDIEMQEIAKEVGYSETAFVLKSDKADFKVRFFTPTDEVDLCGHATIATFNLLRDQNKIKPGIYTQETKAGVLKLYVQSKMVYMQQNRPEFFETLSVQDIKNCFDNEGFVHPEFPIKVVSTGIKEIFIPIISIDALNSLKPNMEEITKVSKKYGCIGIHVFALGGNECDAYGRNFAPVVGIDEESATGTSNGALSCYLYKLVDESTKQHVLRQGYSMGLPSEIFSKIMSKTKKIREIWIGGRALLLEN